MGEDFRAFELAGWREVPAVYHDAAGPLTRQAIPALLAGAAIAPGMRVLDLCTGPGYVAAAVSERGAEALGIDFSPEMLAEASRRHPGVRFEEGDACALSCEDASFDAVLMNFGLLHLAEPERALEEVARVLRRDGRFACTVWRNGGPESGFGIVAGSIQKHGDLAVPLPPAPDFFRFGDPEECRRSFAKAGLEVLQSEPLELSWGISRAEELFEKIMTSTVRTRGLLQGQSPEALERIRAEMTLACSSRAESGSIELSMPALLIVATRT